MHGDVPVTLYLVVLQDKSLYGEPDVGLGIYDGDEAGAHALGCEMEAAMAMLDRCRCVHRVREVVPGRMYRASAMMRTPVA